MIRSYRSLPSAADILNRNNGEGPGFNALRLILSLTILAAHSGWVAGADTSEDWTGFHGIFLLSLVPAFFALSGFLVTGSAVRTGAVRPFIALRAIRIVPALFVEITLSALVLGPLLTSWALRDYFSDIRFWEYFGNVVGRIRFELPGVFEGNPVAGVVNQNLWTLKPEFYCYIVMAGMIAVGLLGRRRLFAILSLATVLGATVAAFATGFGMSGGNYHWTVVVFYFLVGCLYFQWRDHLKIHWALFVFSLLASVALMAAPREYAFFVPFFLTYCVIYVGLLPLHLPARIKKLDVSYGIYLYGFPIQQAIISQTDLFHANGPLLFAISAPIVVLFALFSWLWIEKPFLAVKPYVLGKKTRPGQAPAEVVPALNSAR